MSIRQCLLDKDHGDRPHEMGPAIDATEPLQWQNRCMFFIRAALVKSEDGVKEASIQASLSLNEGNVRTNLSPAELEALERSEAVTDPNIAPASPTGVPVISGQANFLKIAALIVGLAGLLLPLDVFPQSQVDEKVLGGIIAIGTVLGIASPGVRKQ